MLLIAGVGYFVDLFDLTLFGVVRAASLRDLGITSASDVLDRGLFIYNAQMAGLLVGGVLWGVLADRGGRRPVLIGSILLYSVASLASSFVHGVPSYAACRFLCGVGLAGEVGAAVVLVSETLPTELRGIGTTIVTALGLLGVTAAAVIGDLLPWRVVYALGGVMGLALLAARVRLAESPLFSPRSGARWRLPSFRVMGRLLACTAIGVPMYFTTSVILTFSPEIARALDIDAPVSAGRAVLVGSICLAIGDVFAGLISQMMRRRTIVLGGFLVLSAALLLLMPRIATTAASYYTWLGALCVAAGYWVVLMTATAEQFGTDVRGAATTMVPNFVRGSALIAATTFATLRGSMAVSQAAMWVGGVCIGIALLALLSLRDRFARSMDFVDG
jgi:MFS transporter, putative metabolite:H+ symporter